MNLRGLAAIWLGKGVVTATRLSGRGGTTLPGRLARRLDPNLLRRLAAQPKGGVIAVTGTNGKTTTAKLLSAILEADGQRLTHNRAGANLITGLTTAFLQNATWTGRVRGTAGLMEIDEATMPQACKEIRPKAAIVTNFFRDQLDRYGELEHTVNFVGRGLEQLAKGAKAALNADDPNCARLGMRDGVLPFYYGIEADGIGTQEMNQTSDAKHCVRCGAPYDYAVYYYAHLGRYACPSCGHKRPKPEVYVDRIWDADAKGTSFHLVTPAGSFESRLQIPGLYNLYNALAAAAGAHLMGCSLESIKQGLSETTSQFGRMELIPMDGREVFMALVKNPVGFNSVLETVMGPGGNLRGPCEFSPGGGCRPEGSGKKVVIAINDLYADGTDVSWLWDVDFESMAAQQERIDWVICAGIRAEDMAVRLKYAGFDTAKLTTLGDLEGALAQGMQRTPQGEMLYILPTYTAMLGMREIIQKQGHTKKFWEV